MQRRNVYEQTKDNFRKAIEADIDGYSYAVDIIEDTGNGYDPTTGNGYRTRATFTQRTNTSPICRTTHNDPLAMGMLLFFPTFAGDLGDVGSEGFYMLIDPPMQQVDCWKAYPTRCNALLTVKCTVPALTDEYGFMLIPEHETEVIRNIPCVITRAQSLTQPSTGTAGIWVEDKIIATLQAN